MGSQSSEATRKGVLVNPILNKVAEELGKSPAQVALRWGLQQGHSVLPKTSNEERLKNNLDIFNWFIPENLLCKFSEISQASIHFLILPIFPCCIEVSFRSDFRTYISRDLNAFASMVLSLYPQTIIFCKNIFNSIKIN